MLSYLKSLKPVLVMIFIDILLTILAVFSAILIRFDGHIPAEYIESILILILLAVIFNILSLSFFKLFGRLWKYASLEDLFTISQATACSTALAAAVIFFFDLPALPAAT